MLIDVGEVKMEVLKSSVDEEMTIEITPDKMIAVVSFGQASEDGHRLSKEEIKKCIQGKGIVYGLDEKVIEEIGSQRQVSFKYIIARGVAPQKGADASHKFHFDYENLGKVQPKENVDGTVDFKDLNIVYNVTEGQVLYEKIPATDGIEGKNVLGEVVRAQRGKDLRLPKGKNVNVLEDGRTLAAGISGRLCYDNHNIYISPLLVIEEDVDSSTGNIEFIGNILINGNVKNGFQVKASGSIEIHGCVEAADIEAGDDVVIWYGIQGMDKGSIKTTGNLTAKFIQNAKVEASGNIVTEAIMHSEVGANNIYVDKGKGLIVGGKVMAASYIFATTIGSPMATHTDIQIGIPPHILNEFKEVERNYFSIIEEMKKIGQSITFLTTKQTQGELSKERIELLRKLLTTREQIQVQQKEITIKYKELSSRVQSVIASEIKVKNILHPGVKVTIGSQVKYIKEEYSHCSVRKSEADIVIGMY